MCYNCKNQVFGTIETTNGCSQGNTGEFDTWWEENAEKKVTEDLSMPDCFIPTEFSLLVKQLKEDGCALSQSV